MHGEQGLVESGLEGGVASFGQASVRARRISRALAICRGVPGFERVLRHLRNLRVAGAGGERTQAWDQLFEIELAAQFRSTGVALTFEEPDIVIQDDGEALHGIACKRPASLDGVPSACRDAIAQIGKSRFPGVVAISADLLVPPILADSHLEVTQTQHRALRAVTRRLQRQQRARAWPSEASSSRTSPAVVGAVVVNNTFAVYWSASLSRLVALNSFASLPVRNRSIPTSGQPYVRYMWASLQQTLRDGHRNLVKHGDATGVDS